MVANAVEEVQITYRRGDIMLQFPDFPKMLRQRRIELGFTQAQVPGFRQSTIAAYETGRRNPSAANARRLAKVLKCSLERLGLSLVQDAGPMSLHRRKTLQALRHGDIDTAYDLARKYTTIARLSDDPRRMRAANQVMRRVTGQMNPDALMHKAFAQIDKVTLDKLQQWAYRTEQFELALAMADTASGTTPEESPEYSRFMRNRGTILANMGRHAEALAIYDRMAPRAMEELHPNTAVRLILSAAIERFHLGERLASAALEKPAQTTTDFWTWHLYWWLETHIAWSVRDFVRLNQALHVADGEYHDDWPPDLRFVLMGARAALAWYSNQDASLHQEVQQIIANAPAGPEATDGLIQDLLSDWLQLAWERKMPGYDAVWAHQVVTSDQKGMDGWRDHWLQRTPDPIVWERIPWPLHQPLRKILSTSATPQQSARW